MAEAVLDRPMLTLGERTLLAVIARCPEVSARWEMILTVADCEEAQILRKNGWVWPSQRLSALKLLEVALDDGPAKLTLSARGRELFGFKDREHRSLSPRLRISELAAR